MKTDSQQKVLGMVYYIQVTKCSSWLAILFSEVSYLDHSQRPSKFSRERASDLECSTF